MKRLLTSGESKIIDSVCKQGAAVPLILHDIVSAGGQAFLVGGAVRDLIMGRQINDIDIEVHGVSLEALKRIIERHGHVDYVGKSFGVLKFRDEIDIDWSLPRTDQAGRRPVVAMDPHMGIVQALRRRDVTMNAMAINLESYELFDPFGGERDIRENVLRATDATFFIEDPLRLLRVMQFIGRLQMKPDHALDDICRTMDISSVSQERVEQEFKKLFLNSVRPSLGIRWLREVDRLQDVLPELDATVGVEQSAVWHSEGDVFEHTMQTLDAAAVLGVVRFEDDVERRLTLLYAALCHDLGKVTATYRDHEGKVRSIGHDKEGVEPTKQVMSRICGSKDMIKRVVLLVRYHIEPGTYVQHNARLIKYKRLALKLAPLTNVYMLSLLARADKLGRNPDGSEPLQEHEMYVDTFVERAENAGVLFGPEPPVVQGHDFLDMHEPGPVIGLLVKKAYDIQINEGIQDKAILKKRAIAEVDRSQL